MEWNWPTVIILALIGGIIAAIVVSWIVKKKKGQSIGGCGGNCGGCGVDGQGKKK